MVSCNREMGYLILESFRYIFNPISCADPLAFLSKIAYNIYGIIDDISSVQRLLLSTAIIK